MFVFVSRAWSQGRQALAARPVSTHTRQLASILLAPRLLAPRPPPDYLHSLPTHLQSHQRTCMRPASTGGRLPVGQPSHVAHLASSPLQPCLTPSPRPRHAKGWDWPGAWLPHASEPSCAASTHTCIAPSLCHLKHRLPARPLAPPPDFLASWQASPHHASHIQLHPAYQAPPTTVLSHEITPAD